MADDLIRRLEEATEGSRELDVQIAQAVGHPGNMLGCRRYSSSIDAALTLVPEGCIVDQIGEWESEQLRERGPWLAILKVPGQDLREMPKTRCDHAPTLALALCIAALRARGIDMEG